MFMCGALLLRNELKKVTMRHAGMAYDAFPSSHFKPSVVACAVLELVADRLDALQDFPTVLRECVSFLGHGTEPTVRRCAQQILANCQAKISRRNQLAANSTHADAELDLGVLAIVFTAANVAGIVPAV